MKKRAIRRKVIDAQRIGYMCWRVHLSCGHTREYERWTSKNDPPATVQCHACEDNLLNTTTKGT